MPTNPKYSLKIVFHNGRDRVIDNVIEYVGGFRFLFVETGEATLSVPRRKIRQLYRQHGPEADWLPVVLRKPRFPMTKAPENGLGFRQQAVSDRFRPRRPT